ncbi:hypothetical protein ACFQ0O_00260 [Saccharopolyspora spinosporotrichia]
MSLKRMYTEWEQGRVLPTDWRDELCEVFALPPAALGFVDTAPPPSALDIPSALEITRIDAEIVEMLEQQTDHYRLMDRKVGAAIIPQTVAHVEHMEKLLRTALPGKHSHLAAVALAEGAALAGWQALDAGDVTKAWNLHDVAKAAARQGEDPAVFAHVTAQQAYALLDAGRATEAVELVQYAHTPKSRGVSRLGFVPGLQLRRRSSRCRWPAPPGAHDARSGGRRPTRRRHRSGTAFPDAEQHAPRPLAWSLPRQARR